MRDQDYRDLAEGLCEVWRLTRPGAPGPQEFQEFPVDPPMAADIHNPEELDIDDIMGY